MSGDVFARAVTALFARSDFTVAATYRFKAGGSVAVRVLKGAPTIDTNIGGATVRSGGMTFEILQSAVPKPAKGDLVTLEDGSSYRVQGPATAGAGALTWLLDVVEMAAP